MKTIYKIGCLLLLALYLCSFAVSAYARDHEQLQNEVIEICKDLGIRSNKFPENISNDELQAESYPIVWNEQSYIVWIVTTKQQDDAFGWISYQTPNATQLGGWNTRDSYLQEKKLRELEVLRGPYWFWSPDEKALYHQEIHGDASSVVFSSHANISQEDAVNTARQIVSVQTNCSINEVSNFLVDTYVRAYDNSADVSTSEDDPLADHPMQWIVTFRENASSFDLVYSVVIDALDGTFIRTVCYEDNSIIE